MLTYSLTSGDGIGWAIDEDARLLRASLRGVAREVPAPFGSIVHSPFWIGLGLHAPSNLARRMVVAQADNPPFFYLTQPEFAWAQVLVNHWVARSREAQLQFEALGLTSTLIPYAIDEKLFQRAADRERLRLELGLTSQDYVIGNFHRDTEGADLRRPKTQKAPEILVWILKELKCAGVPAVALLAGPRRHWILKSLRKEGLPYIFAGREPEGEDDLHCNILSRKRLAELYTACDVYLIPSRWEGGPQSVMEAAACRCKVVSSRVGVSLDLLEEKCLFDRPQEAVETLIHDYREKTLQESLEPQYERCMKNHTSTVMAEKVTRLYRGLEADASKHPRWSLPEIFEELSWQCYRRLPPKKGRPTVFHSFDSSLELDSRMHQIFAASSLVKETGAIVGKGDPSENPVIQVAEPSTSSFYPGAVVLAGSVQEALNFRERGCRNPLVVFPFASGATYQSAEPLLVEEGDTAAGPSVTSALAAGQCVVYPENLAYRWQVFYDGIPYGARRSRAEALNLAGTTDRPRSERTPLDLSNFLARLLAAGRVCKALASERG